MIQIKRNRSYEQTLEITLTKPNLSIESGLNTADPHAKVLAITGMQNPPLKNFSPDTTVTNFLHYGESIIINNDEYVITKENIEELAKKLAIPVYNEFIKTTLEKI